MMSSSDKAINFKDEMGKPTHSQQKRDSGQRYISHTSAPFGKKNRVKNAEKPAVFTAKKRENRVLFLTGR
jgi:hemolysin-activating ACP:hemolysin acyltransferase